MSINIEHQPLPEQALAVAKRWADMIALCTVSQSALRRMCRDEGMSVDRWTVRYTYGHAVSATTLTQDGLPVTVTHPIEVV